jgi:hypothetical protein
MDSRFDYAAEPMKSSTTDFVTIFSWILSSCVQLPLIYLFVQHKEVLFFKQRGFWTTLVFVAAMLLGQYSGVAGLLFNARCGTIWMIFDFATAWMFATSIERGFLLYVQYNLGVQAKSFVEKDNASKEDKGWILRHRFWFHHRLFSVTKLLSLLIALFIAIPSWVSIQSSPYNQSPFWSVECRALSVAELRTVGIQVICISIGSIIGLWCLRHLKENYFIKLELAINTFYFLDHFLDHGIYGHGPL